MCGKIDLLLCVIIAIHIKFGSSQQLYLSQDETCPLSNNQTGTCKLLSECPYAKYELESLNRNPIICSFQGIIPVVCCQPIPDNNIRRKKYNYRDSCTHTDGRTGICDYTKRCKFETKTIIADDWNWCFNDFYAFLICCPNIKPKHMIACNDYKISTGEIDENYDVDVIFNPFIEYFNESTLGGGQGAGQSGGGLPAKYGEFPHMALVGFGNENNVEWACGGSLISEKFVLTAAHCLFLQNLGEATIVRLGELDLSEKKTSHNVPENFYISERIPHPDYRPPQKYNDIALLKLDRIVQFTTAIYPACLYDKYTVPYSKLNATGWGAQEFGGEFSNHLFKVDLSIYTFEECYSHYDLKLHKKVLSHGIDNNTQICSGGKDELKDTCEGDSGGPLQLKHNGSKFYYVVGVTSFGNPCLITNSPGVYTRVSAFIPWIENIVWDQV